MYYPRSFLRFILLGLLLVGLPLLYAIGELIVYLDRLSIQSQQAVQRAAQAGRASRQFLDQATGLERVVRQYLILDDRTLLDDYRRLRQEFQQTYRQLTLVNLDPEDQLQLDKLLHREARLHVELGAPWRGTQDSERLAEEYAEVAEGAQGILAAASSLTERETDLLRLVAEEGRQRWVWLAAAAVVIALVLALVFAMLVSRPIRQIDQAIRQMGTADFTHEFRVDGPQELRYLGQRLEWLRERLRDLEQQQTRFLRQVSHELKTPLTVVREGAELLRDRVGGTLSPEQDEIVRIVRENTLQLQRLIEDLLSYQQQGRVDSPSMKAVDLGEVVRRVVREQKLAAYARMLAVETRLDPAAVNGDAEKLRVIVDNLLSNAIKYSPRGGRVEVVTRTDGGSALLEVTDEGPGIDPDERQRVFESFYLGKRAPDGRIKGTGLGLAITREYVLAHAGEIEVGDRGDGKRGARFRIRIPLGTEPAAAKIAPRERKGGK